MTLHDPNDAAGEVRGSDHVDDLHFFYGERNTFSQKKTQFAIENRPLAKEIPDLETNIFRDELVVLGVKPLFQYIPFYWLFNWDPFNGLIHRTGYIVQSSI